MADRAQAGQRSWEGEMFRLLVENVKDHAIFVVDAEGRVQTWSQGAERLLGYTEGDILGQSAARFFTPEDRANDVPRREMRRALETGRGEDERWHVRKDGSRFWSSGVMTPLRDQDGTVRGFAKILRDITDRKRADDARNDALAYAENIVATVREPLVVLDGDLRVRTANRSFYSTFHVAKEETEGRLLYALGNGQWDIPALRKLLEEVLPQNTSFNDFEVAHNLEVIGHKVMLLNARRIYRKGNDTELILLAIEDITERRRLEDPLGIGLALVKGLTEAHGGRVEVRSEGIGHGCTFIVRLPVAQAEAPAEKQPSHDPGRPGPKHRILVVDDNRDGAASLAMLLTVLGNDTRTAHDGLEGVELAEAFRPDLIVLDIGLPRLNGYDACRRIREKPWARNTLIVAATGWGQEEDRRRSKEAGFDHHLVKPVNADEIIRLLAERRVGGPGGQGSTLAAATA